MHGETVKLKIYLLNAIGLTPGDSSVWSIISFRKHV